MKDLHPYQGPLAGLNIVDFGHYYAGPMVGMVLADQGANVVRIVKPGEKELPTEQFQLFNRNKQLLTLDLKAPEGQAQALSLIEKADVLIENFRPGVMKRLGLDYASVKDANPGLVYLSLPGFASTDKERAHLQAWEGVMSAASCVFTQSEQVRQIFGFPPHYTWLPVCSAQGAMRGAYAVMASLLAREQHGKGVVIEAPLVNAGVGMFSIYIAGYPMMLDPQAELPEPLKPFQYQQQDNHDTQLKKLREGCNALFDSLFYYRDWTCKDQRKLFVWWLYDEKLVLFLKTIGLYHSLLEEGFVYVPIKDYVHFPRLNNNLNDFRNLVAERKTRLVTMVADRLRDKTAAEWEAIFQQAGLASALIRRREEWLALQPLMDSGVLVDMAQQDESPLIVPGRVVDVSGPNGALMSSYRNVQTCTAEQANTLFGAANAAEGKPVNSAAASQPATPLAGLKVLDLTNILAGPTAGYTLAQLGADVIKADPPFDGGPVPMLYEANQGKRSIITDLSCASGREVFRRLVLWADVVLHNSIDRVAERLGVTQQQLQAINPNVVVAQFSAFGGTWRGRGGWENRSGFDPMAQAASGMMVHYGTMDAPLSLGSVSIDIAGGLSLAFGALLGVYQQRETGYAGEVRGSLARAANFVQLPVMIRQAENSEWGEVRGQFSMGPSWHQRIYRCRDGWIYLHVNEDRAPQLAELLTGQSVLLDENTPLNENAIEQLMQEQRCDVWLEKLQAANMAAHRVLTVQDFRDQAVAVSNAAAVVMEGGAVKILRRDDHPSGIAFMTVDSSWFRFGEGQAYNRLAVAPRSGEHSLEILTRLGFSESDRARLLQSKSVHEYLPAVGSKEDYSLRF